MAFSIQTPQPMQLDELWEMLHKFLWYLYIDRNSCLTHFRHHALDERSINSKCVSNSLLFPSNNIMKYNMCNPMSQ